MAELLEILFYARHPRPHSPRKSCRSNKGDYLAHNMWVAESSQIQIQIQRTEMISGLATKAERSLWGGRTWISRMLLHPLPAKESWTVGAAAPEKMHLNVSKNLKRNFFISVGAKRLPQRGSNGTLPTFRRILYNFANMFYHILYRVHSKKGIL